MLVSPLLDKIFEIRFQFWNAEALAVLIKYCQNSRRKNSRRYAYKYIAKVALGHNFATRALRIINKPSKYMFSGSSFPMGTHSLNFIKPFFFRVNFLRKNVEI